MPSRCLVGALLLASAASLAFAERAPARSFDTGLLDLNTFETNDSLQFGRARAANAKYLKITIYWPSVAPNPDSPTKPAGFNPRDPSDPGYTWTIYDQQIRLADANGLDVIIDVTNAPRWARAACTTDPTCSPAAGDFADFATAVAARYSGAFNPGPGPLPRVRHYQAWLEPNLNFFYKPTFQNGKPVAPGNYRTILNAFADAVHAVDPSNQVISAGLAPLSRGRTTIGPLDFMRRLLCLTGRTNPHPQGGCNQRTKLDIWATHPYTTGGPTHEAPGADDVSLGDLPEMTRTLRAADRAGKIQNQSRNTPFWVTEFSWDSNPPDRGGLKSTLHARWLAEAFYRMFKAGVSTVIWFQLRDEAKNGRPDADVYQSGLYLRGATLAQDKPKLALKAFKFPFVALREGNSLVIWGRTPDSRAHGVSIQIKGTSGGFRQLVHLRANGAGVFEKTIRSNRFSLLTNGFRAGSARARIDAGPSSLAFSLRYARDFYQPPFGGNPRRAYRISPLRR